MSSESDNIASVRLSDLRRYFSLHGWSVQAGPSLDIYTLSDGEGDPIEIGLPREAASVGARTAAGPISIGT